MKRQVNAERTAAIGAAARAKVAETEALAQALVALARVVTDESDEAMSYILEAWIELAAEDELPRLVELERKRHDDGQGRR